MKTIFLDRDGVINKTSEASSFIQNPPNYGYAGTWEEFAFIPNARKAIRNLTQNGYRVIVITNQAGIGRSIFTEENLKDIHRRMVIEVAAAGGKIHAVYYCPHHPDVGCECRKPKPGMLLRAARDHGVDVSRTYFIGDSLTDIEAGHSAGASTILVLTGHGRESYRRYIHSQRADANAITPQPDKIFTNLYAAVCWLTETGE